LRAELLSKDGEVSAKKDYPFSVEIKQLNINKEQILN
jgi:hypothetical protein